MKISLFSLLLNFDKILVQLLSTKFSIKYFFNNSLSWNRSIPVLFFLLGLSLHETKQNSLHQRYQGVTFILHKHTHTHNKKRRISFYIESPTKASLTNCLSKNQHCIFSVCKVICQKNGNLRIVFQPQIAKCLLRKFFIKTCRCFSLG